MVAEAEFKVNDLVRIGKGRKVYSVWRVFPPQHQGRPHYLYRLEPAHYKHPDGARRVPNAFVAYTADELTRVQS